MQEEMTMNGRNESLKRAAPFAAGVLIGLSVVTPVFAATLDVETLQPLLLLGSLIVLLIGLALKAMASARPSTRSRASYADAQDAHDLRRRTGSTVDIALPNGALR
jgi:hypothetical protein